MKIEKDKSVIHIDLNKRDIIKFIGCIEYAEAYIDMYGCRRDSKFISNLKKLIIENTKD